MPIRYDLVRRLTRVVAVAVVVLAAAAVAPAQDTRARLVRTDTVEAPATPPAVPPPAGDYVPLRDARTLYVDSHTAYLKGSLLEEKLQGQPEFGRLGLQITRDPRAAGLVVVVERAIFTTEFIYSIVDTRTSAVVASGKANSLFGTASGKIAKQLTTKFARARGVASHK
jgi:hypothetical protein